MAAVLGCAAPFNLQILKRLASGKQPEYGWVPTQQTRSYESFMAACALFNFVHFCVMESLLNGIH